MLRSFGFCLLVMLCSIVTEGQITSTFETDADGWTLMDGAASQTIIHNPTGGNPTGYISSTFNASTGATVESWIAPPKFLGNQVVRSLGMNLTFDLQQSIASTSSGPNGSVRIENGSNVLVYSFIAAERPGTSWRSYSLKLDETGGWRWSSAGGVAATRSQVIQVLTNITALEIRASYATNASYTASLDNVTIDQKTLGIAPIVSSFAPTSGEPGTTVTITGTDFDPVAANNAVYFSGIEGNITSASPTELEVEIPTGARYGLITVINKTTGLLHQSLNPFSPTFPDGGRIISSSLDSKIDISLTGVADIYGLTSADIDGDGWLDVIVSESGGTTSVLRNLGTGGDLTASSFAPKVSLSGSGAASGVYIVDLDGDGKNDIAAAYSDGFLMSFATFRNTSTPGNISFETFERWAGLVYSGALATVVDVDGDGRLDLIGQHGNGSVSPDFWIAQNISTPGDIEFSASRSYFGGATLDAGDGVSYGDLDNDGKPEIIVEHSFGGQFQILKNNSTPGIISFGTPFVINEGVSGGVVVADFNLDGLNDIAFKQGSSNDDVVMRLNTFAGGTLSASDFATQVIFNCDLFNYGGLSIADINGDSRPDIMMSDASNIAVFENAYAGGAFDNTAFIPGYLHQGAGTSTYPTTPVAADFNGDNKLDILIGITNVNPIRLSFFENKNVHAPVISLTTVSPLAGPVGSRVTITGDYFSTTPSLNLVKFGGVSAEVVTASKTELTVEVPNGAAYGAVSVTRDELTAKYHLPFNVLFSPGTTLGASSFGSPINFTVPTADFDIDAADLDGDNKIDLVVEGASQQSYFIKNSHSSGSITTASLTPQGNTASGAANPKLIDLNGDGKPDITSIQGSFRNTSTPGTISFDAVTGISGSTNIGHADLNLDGKLDVVGINATVIEVHENQSRPGPFLTGTFATMSDPFNLASGGTAVASAVADFDNDGWQDIAATVNTTGVDNVVIFKNNGAYQIAVSQFSNVGTFATLDLPGRIYEGDLDVDGKMDLVVYQQAAGTNGNMISVFHNTSTGIISFARIDYQLGPTPGTAGTIGGPSTISDLDGDGRPEIIVTSASTNTTRQGFYILKNNSSPGIIDATSFTSSGLIALSGARAVHAADLNLDHRPELIFTRNGSLLSVMENLIVPTTLTFNTQPATATLCDVMDADLFVDATGDNNLQYRWQKLNSLTGKYEDVPDDATYEGISSQTLEISYPPLVDTYRAVVQGDYSLAISASAVLTVSTTPSAPGVTGDTECSGSTVSLAASGGMDGNYRWYTVASGGTALAGEVNSIYMTPALTTTTSYFVALNNSGCESTRSEVIATLNTVSPPTVTGGARCDAGTVSLSGAGGTNGQYRWYLSAVDPAPISGEVNSTFTTPSLSATTSYFISIHDGVCESTRAEVIASINATPSAPTPINNARCDNGPLTLGAAGGTNGNYRWYTTSSGGAAISGEINGSYVTPSLTSTTSFFVSQVVNSCESTRAEVVATIGSVNPPLTTGLNICANTSANFTASGAVDGQYRWYSSAVGGSAIAGEVNSSFTTPNLTTTTSYFVSIANGSCESTRTEAIASVTSIASPATTSASRCGSGSLTLTASGGTNGNYRWYDVATGGTAIAGATNDSFTTPPLSATITYHVALSDGTCESLRIPVSATINNTPSKPVITSSPAAAAGIALVCSGQVNLSAPAGFSYLWSNGATTQQLVVSTMGTFTVQVTDGNNCTSVASDAIQVVIDPNACNTAPVITPEPLTAAIAANISLTLSDIVTDAENNLDNVIIVSQPISGATATIVNGVLIIDYANTSFSGTDRLVIRACDFQNLCSEDVIITIEVVGEIEIYNAVSPNGDGLNEFLKIEYIEILERTKNNKVTILNRWGDKVFETSNYDNNTRAFKGLNNGGVELPSGTYFYKIEFMGPNAPPMRTGYFVLKR